MKQLGLIGRNISYSFSENYFKTKFEELNLTDFDYQIFDLKTINEAEKLFKNPSLLGFNVTIPYKQEILPFLDDLSEEAKEIGAVNTVKISNGKIIGYNTDAFGFEESLKPLLKNHYQKALILGNGGAAKAVKFVLNKLNIPYLIVTRKEDEFLSFEQLDSTIIKNHQIIINCTPIGTFPNISDAPLLPYDALTANHLLYDLIYNPTETLFLQNGQKNGATIKNGLEMLHLQAEKAWGIWTH